MLAEPREIFPVLTIVATVTSVRSITRVMTDDSYDGHSPEPAVNSFDSQPNPRPPAFEIEGSIEFEYTE